MEETYIAWLAGFYEGEGSIVGRIHNHNRDGIQNRMLQWTLAQKDKSDFALHRAKAIIVELGVEESSVCMHLHKASGVTQLRVSSYEEIEKIMLAIWKYLSPKRKAQAQEQFLIYCEDFIPRRTSGKYQERWSNICDMYTGDTFPS